jgi:hypothetical protein
MMAMHGEIKPMPEGAIFADTGGEPQAVYDWLDWLEKQLSFPVYRVMQDAGLKNNIVNSATNGARAAQPPFFAANGGLLRRNCTADFKVVPITKKVRELVGLKPRQRAPKDTILATQWIGISLDEIQRMKEPREKWLKHRWPLIELRMTRGHCLEWMQDHGYPRPPRSACTFCPYRSNKEWRDMRERDFISWNDAVEMDDLIRDGVRGTKEKLYLHRSMVPLDEVDLSDPQEGQAQFSFMDECDGLCGT